MSIINKIIVLKLNKAWQPVGFSSVQKAIVDLCGGIAVKAIDLEYELDDSGEPVGDPIRMNPVDWDEWITLCVRPYDLVLHSAKLQIRVPTVLVAKNFNRMPMKTFRGKPSKDGIRIRDRNRCQYTGHLLRREEITIDHVIPQSRGGHDNWENLVTTSKELNSKKGNKLNEEAGLHLIRKPTVPAPMPLSMLINEIRHRDWLPFLLKVNH